MGIEVDVTESAGINPRITEGTYAVRLAGIQEKILDVTKVENGQTTIEEVPRFEWVFALRQNDGKVIKFTALTSPKFSTKSKAFSFSKALLGKALETGKKFNTDDLIGKYATAIVKDKEPKADKTGQIQITSEIKDMLPLDKAPEPAIEIEGIFVPDEVEAEPEPVKTNKTKRK